MSILRKSLIGLVVLGLWLTAQTPAAAQGITIPNTFTNGTVADADQVNANFAALSNGALNRTGGTMTGTLTAQSVIPSSTTTYSLGDATHLWLALYAPLTNLTLTSQAQYDLIYAATASTWGRLANGTSGQVLTATTSGAPSWAAVGGPLGICDLVLTAATANPYPTTDVTGATSVYVTPVAGGSCAFYDGSTGWTTLTNAEVAVALGTLTSGQGYDVFCYNNSGTMACDAPLAWTNGTTRATAIASQNNVDVKTGATTRRYMGSFYTTSTTTTEDSYAKRLVWSRYDRIPRGLRAATETADSWNYPTLTWRQANGNTANQLEYMVGMAQSLVDVTVVSLATGDSSGAQLFSAGIGFDSTTTLGTGCLPGTAANGNAAYYANMVARCSLQPAVGRHTAVWLEAGDKGAGAAITFYGDKGNATFYQSGIMGTIR